MVVQQNSKRYCVYDLLELHLSIIFQLLDKCNYDESTTTLILVGDLVNKGPYSAETVKFVRSINAHVVRGNHDDFALAVALKKISKLTHTLHYLNDLNDEDINWLNNLPYTISIPSCEALIVHAGIVPGISLDNQKPGDMHSMRNIETVEVNNEIILQATTSGSVGKPWIEYYKTKPHVYFGKYS